MPERARQALPGLRWSHIYRKAVLGTPRPNTIAKIGAACARVAPRVRLGLWNEFSYLGHEGEHVRIHTIARTRQVHRHPFRNNTTGANEYFVCEEHRVFDAVRHHKHADSLFRKDGEYFL